MKKSFLLTLLAFSLAAFLALSLVLYLASHGYAALGDGQLAEYELLFLLAAPFFGLVCALSVYNAGNTQELGSLPAELGEGASRLFGAALYLARTPAFRGFWLTLLLLLLGAVGLSRLQVLHSAFLVLAGLALWALQRPVLTLLPAALPSHLGLPLRALLFLPDLAAFLGTASVIEALSHFDLLAKGTALAAAVAVVVPVLWLCQRAGRRPAGMNGLLFSAAAFLWCLLLLLYVNYAFDSLQPKSTSQVTLRECNEHRDQVYKGAVNLSEDPGRFNGCWVLRTRSSFRLDDAVETVELSGALGLSWRRYYVNPEKLP